MNLSNLYIEKILVEFIKNETSRVGISNAVIGLSGGIDSAVSAYLSVKALGKENVKGLLMPFKTSSSGSLSDAMKVVDDLGIAFKKIEITDVINSIVKSIGDENISRIRKGNLMARVRMILLYDESAVQNALVIGTSNKSEMLLGYSTIYGDSASAINPIGDLYKTQIISLAKHLGVPEDIINKKPSADLWEGQSDEDELGFTYSDVDKYLQCKIDERMSEEELQKKGFDSKFIKRVNSLIIKSQYKRITPLIAKISNRTINIDFRYNRDWNT